MVGDIFGNLPKAYHGVSPGERLQRQMLHLHQRPCSVLHRPVTCQPLGFGKGRQARRGLIRVPVSVNTASRCMLRIVAARSGFDLPTYLPTYLTLACMYLSLHGKEPVSVDSAQRAHSSSVIKHGRMPSGYASNLPGFSSSALKAPLLILPLNHSDSLV
jgi:hypothetical protein